MKSLKSQARITGLLYLFVIICAGFSQGYVRANLVIPGDAVATASNILENIGLFRLGLASDMIAFIVDAIISVMLYQLLKPYGQTLALASSALRLIAHPAIGALNLLNHFMAYHVLSGADFLSTFDNSQLESLSLLFMDAHRYGYLIAGDSSVFTVCYWAFYSLEPNGSIASFGWMIILAAMGYLAETFGDFLYPGNEEVLAWIVGLSAALGEVELTLFLLIKGIRKTQVANSKLNES